MKRLIAFAAVCISFHALAALPAATDPTIVSVPQLPGGFFIGGTAYYLQPSTSADDLDYAGLTTSTISLASTGAFTAIKSVDPGYNWGWGVNAGYIFPGTGNDVEVNYFRINTSDTNSITATQTIMTDLFAIAGNTGSIDGFPTTIEGKAEYTFNRVDLTLGQYIDLGCRLILHPKLGLTWAEIERELITDSTARAPNFVNLDGTVSHIIDVVTTNENSQFKGIGPLFGIDANYYIANGFGLVGHADTALLVGDIDSDFNSVEVTRERELATGELIFAFNGFQNTQSESVRRVVPVMDGKLGLDYTFVFNNTANSDLTLEAGWQVSHYFNAVDRIFSVSRTTADVSLNGPYVSLVLHV